MMIPHEIVKELYSWQNRKGNTYRAIKKMSREELQAFLMRYANGLLENDSKTIDLREVEKDLPQIKGIGDKHIEEIMAVIEKHLGV